ncbi:hypothetical protein Hbl1158_13245 [Halobaculum sp. CBA1158]|uniref:hypothetical protein n=1 Tax=Halobaculum sp. CBA1158 TaxID=2904243 RepID=UPI001F318AB4|nr:hypothetical protein [Halobaculum sp. CBA1158]UIO99477.1 hypothetical protein Hbl1158_13245 [Halobaculum sp. CBA1158]
MSSESGSGDGRVPQPSEEGVRARRPLPARIRRWVLLTGNRRLVAAGLVGVVPLVVIPLSPYSAVEVTGLFTRSNTARLFDTLLSGVILLVSIVVSVASLVVSQELSPVGQQRDRIERATEFRRETEELLDASMAPAQIGDFLRAVAGAVLSAAQDLQSAVEDNPGHPGLDEATDGDPTGEVARLVELADAEAERATRGLDGSEPGSIGVLLATLEYDYAAQLHALRGFRARREEELPAAAEDAVDGMVEALQRFAAAREFVKSLYFEREFARLSRDLLVVSIPVIVGISYVILAVDVADITGRTLGVSNLLVFMTVGYAAALAPFMTLTSYVLRAATVALRTLSAGPFVLDADGSAGHANEE